MTGRFAAHAAQLFHPPMAQLQRFHIRAKFQKLIDRVRTPQRRWLVMLSITLGCVWLGQAALGIFFRTPASPQQLQFWLPAAMATYCLWHLIKVLTKTPETPFDWTPAEQELLHGAPITRLQTIVYRFRSIVVAAFAKAACFALVMIPDVPSVPLALVGMFGGLLLIDGIRLLMEIGFDAMTHRERWLCRIGVIGPVLTLLIVAFLANLAVVDPQIIPARFLIDLTLAVVGSFSGLLQTSVGGWLLVPFEPFRNIITANGNAGYLLLNLVASLSLLATCFFAVTWLDRVATDRNKQLEQQQWNANQERTSTEPKSANLTNWLRFSPFSPKSILIPGWHFGCGAVAWRQMLGAWHYRNAVRFALLVPTILCCLPMFTKTTTIMMLFNIVGSLVFYTFLLLPSGLILDYRRDIDRMAVLKSLPISAWALTVGQLTTPVLLASIFQALVLTIGSALGAITVTQAAFSFIVLIPFNVLNFALENYIFMLSPYRRNEEGVMVFVRTILTFTAKGILFGLAFGVVFGWALLTVKLGAMIMPGAWFGPILFACSLWCMVCAAAYFVSLLLKRRIEEFDVTIDCPAVS